MVHDHGSELSGTDSMTTFNFDPTPFSYKRTRCMEASHHLAMILAKAIRTVEAREFLNIGRLLLNVNST
jgi:hypothetical protein